MIGIDTVTLYDCILYAAQGFCAVINDGILLGFEKEEIPTQTANQGGDE